MRASSWVFSYGIESDACRRPYGHQPSQFDGISCREPLPITLLPCAGEEGDLQFPIDVAVFVSFFLCLSKPYQESSLLPLLLL